MEATPPPPTSDLSPAVLAAYVVLGKVGAGVFGCVYRVSRRRDSRIFALKVVRKDALDSEAEQLLRNEQAALQLISEHPGVVTLHETLHTEREVCFVLDYVPGGPLLDQIVERGNFSENDARLSLRACLRTLAFMVRVGVVHRDIKPENLLCDTHDREWALKLTDFGLSAKLRSDRLLNSACGTPLFAAPEVLSQTLKGYGVEADAWSFGVVLYVVLCGYPPFARSDPVELVRAIRTGDFRFPDAEWRFISPEAKDVVRRLLTVDPKHRLTPAEALQHTWFKAKQSTNALPNKQLEFFAKRRIRAITLSVRTACCLLKMRSTANATTDTNGTSEKTVKLYAEVEQNRAFISQLERKNSNNNGDDDANGGDTGTASRSIAMPQRSPRKKPSILSLVLPPLGLDTADSSDITPPSRLVNLRTIQPCIDGSEEDRRALRVMHELRKSQVRMSAAVLKPALQPLDFGDAFG